MVDGRWTNQIIQLTHANQTPDSIKLTASHPAYRFYTKSNHTVIDMYLDLLHVKQGLTGDTLKYVLKLIGTVAMKFNSVGYGRRYGDVFGGYRLVSW